MSRAAATALVLGALALAAGIAGGQASPAAEADPREAELAAIRQEIAGLEGRIGAMRSREASLGDQLDRTRVEQQLQERQVAEATAAHALAASRAEAVAAKVGELETALDKVRLDLRRRLGGLYRLGRQGYLRLFLALEPDRELLPAIRQLRFLVQRDRQSIDHYVATRDELSERRAELEQRLAEAEAWKRREVERRGELSVVRRRQERLLAEVAAERLRLAERSDRLQDKAEKLAKLLESLFGESRETLSGTPISDFHGALDWPYRGEVVGRFGPRLDPRYRTEVPHNGIDLRSRPGDAIRAVFPGEVLYADPFEGYGNMVVVHHPGRVFTLYAGLGELKVARGGVVSLGDVLGLAAEELYFEIRQDNQPVDPLEWLR